MPPSALAKSPDEVLARVPAVDKSCRILGFIAANPDATIREISMSLGLSKSTVADIVQVLCEMNFLDRSLANSGVRLGHNLITLGTVAKQQIPEGRSMRAVLQELTNQWECNVIVVQRLAQSFSFVIIESLSAPKAKAVTLAVGSQLNFSAPAVSRAYLSGLSEPESKEIVMLWRKHTAAEIDLGKFLAPISVARKLGYATAAGEYSPEYNSAAAPVRDRKGRVKSVLALVGYPRQLPSKKLDDAGRALRLAAGQLEGMRSATA